jgi:hypothetical protein
MFADVSFSKETGQQGVVKWLTVTLYTLYVYTIDNNMVEWRVEIECDGKIYNRYKRKN